MFRSSGLFRGLFLWQKMKYEVLIAMLMVIFLNFIYNISLSITSANLTKKAICTWLAYKKNNNKHDNNDKKEL